MIRPAVEQVCNTKPCVEVRCNNSNMLHVSVCTSHQAHECTRFSGSSRVVFNGATLANGTIVDNYCTWTWKNTYISGSVYSHGGNDYGVPMYMYVPGYRINVTSSRFDYKPSPGSNSCGWDKYCIQVSAI